MSKVVLHTRLKNIAIKKGETVRTTHEHLTLAKTGYIPTGTNNTVNIKVAKKGKYASQI